jgi:hypothetical protein
MLLPEELHETVETTAPILNEAAVPTPAFFIKCLLFIMVWFGWFKKLHG